MIFIQVTGRTESVFIRTTQEIKKILVAKRKKEGFNVCEWFEQKFNDEFFPSIEKLEKEKAGYLQLVEDIENRIGKLTKKDIEESKLILNSKELRIFVTVCDPKLNLDNQYKMFRAAAKKDINLEQFIRIKQKYSDKIIR